MNPRFTKLGLPLVVLLALSVFQNCDAPVHKGDGNSSLDANAAEFTYPYASKPDFYAEIALFRPAAPEGTALSSFVLVAGARYLANLTADVQYVVQIKSAAGATLCPETSGTLTAGKSAIQFSCVSAVLAPEAVVHLKLTAAGMERTFQTSFAGQ